MKRLVHFTYLIFCITLLASCNSGDGIDTCREPTMGMGACVTDCEGECVLDYVTDSGTECFHCELPSICARDELLEENCEELCTEGVCEYAYSTSRGQRCFNCIDACNEPYMTATECEHSDCERCKAAGQGLYGADCYVCDDCPLPLLDSYSCISTCDSDDCEWVKESPGGKDCYQCVQPDDCSDPLMSYTECRLNCTGECYKSKKHHVCWECESIETICESPSMSVQECEETCTGPGKHCVIIPSLEREGEACAECEEQRCDAGLIPTNECASQCPEDHECKHVYSEGHLNCSECVPREYDATDFVEVKPGELCFDENLQPTPCGE